MIENGTVKSTKVHYCTNDLKSVVVSDSFKISGLTPDFVIMPLFF